MEESWLKNRFQENKQRRKVPTKEGPSRIKKKRRHPRRICKMKGERIKGGGTAVKRTEQKKEKSCQKKKNNPGKWGGEGGERQ